MRLTKKHLTAFLLALTIVTVPCALSACSDQSNNGNGPSESASISSEPNGSDTSGSDVSDTEEIESSDGDSGMHHVPIDDTTMNLITGTWRTKGIMSGPNGSIQSIDDSKNLADQYGRLAITVNPDKTFEYNKKNGVEQGIWDYFGIQNDMYSFAMKTTSGEREGTVYLVYLVPSKNTDLIVVHEQGKDIEGENPVMAKAKSPSSSSSTQKSQNTNDNAPKNSHSPTTGEANALALAQSYLNTMAFSYSGLVKQLEYEGFTKSEATYGADNCGADWNEQAARKAREYLNTMSFSKSKLIEQLEYEGFTKAQAQYGVSQAY